MQSNYMGVGGTNWGWLPDPDVYTSYDYGAAIRETGEIGTPADPDSVVGSKYGENKLINDFETSVAPLTGTQPAAAPTADNPAVTTLARANPADGTQFIYVRQADATSTATVSTHLALNADETAGYTDDDASSALTYAGAWTHAGPSTGYTAGDYDSTESWSTQAGASMTVAFTGTAVQWIGPKGNNGGIADVYLDGTLAGTVDTYAAAGKEFQQVLFSRTGLAAGSHTVTITVTGTQNPASSADTVVIDAVNVPTAAQLADYYPVVPQQGSLTLDGRDARLLVANYGFGGQQLVYSTSELMTQATIGGQDTALLYGPAGTDGETVLRYASQPAVTVLSGSVQATWDASRGDLRLDYVHQGLAEVAVTGGGATPPRLLIASSDVAQEFWPESTPAGPVLVEGGYLVAAATTRGPVLALTGDTSRAGAITVWAPPSVHAVLWNGGPVAVTAGQDGSLTGAVPGPAALSLPALSGWRFSAGAPEAQPGFDDSSWTLADHPVSNASSPSTPVLYASDYGYQHGFTWYRGHFTATGTETGVRLTADGIAPAGRLGLRRRPRFTWPDMPPAEPDNTMAEGQTIAVSGSGSTLGFVAAANNSPESGTGTIYYTDGSTQSFTLGVGNFWSPAGQDGNPSNVQVAGVNYANYPTGSSGHEVYIFEQSVTLETGKTIEAVTLPALGDVAGYNAALHIFAMTVG